jgi:ribosomal protein S18 acetylase RimI-like enzyme
MTTLVLSCDEWAEIVKPYQAAAWACLDANAKILVIEDEGRVVGCAGLLPYLHVEGLWIDPAYRKRASVGRRLLQMLRGAADAMRTRSVVSMIGTPEMDRIARALGGQPLPLPVYDIPIGVE